MNTQRLTSLLALTGCLAMVSGCGWCCRSRGCAPYSAASPVVAATPPCCNGGRTTYAAPLTTPPSYYQAPYQAPVGQPPIGSAPLPQPPAATDWRTPPTQRPGVFEIPGSSESGKSNGARLMPPTSDEPKPPPKDLPPPEAPSEKGALDKANFTAEIPRFFIVYDNVHAGTQPFPEGFTWLKSQGYRTVVHIRPVGADDAAARAEIEAKGLRYVSLEVGPKSLTRELVQEFGRVINDTNGHPLFVYDKNGMLAGTMWYLHFRLNEQKSDADSRGRAVRLGLKDDQTGENAELWLAIQKLVQGS